MYVFMLNEIKNEGEKGEKKQETCYQSISRSERANIFPAGESYRATVGIYGLKVDELQRVGGQPGIVLCLFVFKLSIY